MRGPKYQPFIGFLFSVVPYAVVAWAWTDLTEGRAKDFWTAVGVLIAARTFFAVIEWIGGIVAWRLYGRQYMIDRLVAAFRHPKVPLRDLDNDAAVFDFDVLRPHLQVEMLRWLATAGLLPDGKTEDVIWAAMDRYSQHKKSEQRTGS